MLQRIPAMNGFLSPSTGDDRQAPTTVLVIDASTSFRAILSRFLVEHWPDQFCVYSAGSAQEALIQAAAHEPRVILLDVRMLWEGWPAAIPMLRQILPRTPVIVLTLIDLAVYHEAARQAGAAAVLGKAALATELVPTIQRLLAEPVGDRGCAPGFRQGVRIRSSDGGGLRPC